LTLLTVNRSTDNTQTLIDHILTNIISAEITPRVLHSDLSDHSPTYAIFIQKAKFDIIRRNMSKFDSKKILLILLP